MFISAKPYRATLHQTSDAECLLIFKCEACDDSGILELGSDYVFASQKHLNFISRRRNLALNVRIRRASQRKALLSTDLNPPSTRIGPLSFCPPMASVGITACLEADVVIDDKFFESIVDALRSGKKSEWLQIDVDGGEVLKYGWEPDGSRMEWKLENLLEISTVGIARFSISFELMQ